MCRHSFGASPSGKAPAFGAGIRRFESYRPSHFLSLSLMKRPFDYTMITLANLFSSLIAYRYRGRRIVMKKFLLLVGLVVFLTPLLVRAGNEIKDEILKDELDQYIFYVL